MKTENSGTSGHRTEMHVEDVQKTEINDRLDEYQLGKRGRLCYNDVRETNDETFKSTTSVGVRPNGYIGSRRTRSITEVLYIGDNFLPFRYTFRMEFIRAPIADHNICVIQTI